MVRTAALEDLEHVAGLEALLFPDNSINEASLQRELGWSRCYVIGRPAHAYLIARFGPKVIDILRVGVHPEFRRRGYARRLIEEVLESAFLPVILTVKRENAPARQLYRSMGFEPIAMVPQADALLLRARASST